MIPNGVRAVCHVCRQSYVFVGVTPEQVRFRVCSGCGRALDVEGQRFIPACEMCGMSTHVRVSSRKLLQSVFGERDVSRLLAAGY